MTMTLTHNGITYEPPVSNKNFNRYQNSRRDVLTQYINKRLRQAYNQCFGAIMTINHLKKTNYNAQNRIN